MTFEDYLKQEYAEGKIDFSLRFDGRSFYIHPTGKNGSTTPNLLVKGNTVCMAPGCAAPGWGDTLGELL